MDRYLLFYFFKKVMTHHIAFWIHFGSGLGNGALGSWPWHQAHSVYEEADVWGLMIHPHSSSPKWQSRDLMPPPCSGPRSSLPAVS